ncbi:MAG: methionine--tRNA ligase [Gammaproteobacteria bacterium]|nr:MAG: methionine--tRNA ligase [Gammaproteobacteria bacterium]
MPSTRKILATQALPYANGVPHLGHLVGMVQTDIWVRLQKMQGHDCLFVCGSDSHGTPIMIQAEKMGITPQALIEQIQREQERDFTDFHIEFDCYHTTHSAENKELVATLFQRHVERGNIDKRTIKQLFDPVKNMFLPDRYIKGECPNCGAKDQYGDNCELCGATYLPTDLKNPYSTLSGAKPIEKESEHYFFKLQNYEKFLKEWTRRGHLQEQVANKLDEWFKDGLKEWDISRDAPYFGFLIPGEKEKYFYVWLDAPVGYIASFKKLCEQRKELNFDDYWGPDSSAELIHFIGKDIIYFHALFWPAILHGANLRTPNEIVVNGFLTIDGQKMSKSRGTFIKARTYLNHLPAEYLRYYFAAKLSDRIEDLDIHFDDFTNRINADLVGKFVNIASRCASFINKHFAGKLAAQCAEPALYQTFAQAGEEISEKWEKMCFSQAIRHIMALADRANQYIDEKKPWTMIKDPQQQAEVQAVCSMGINLFRVLMIYLKPVLPQTAKQVESFLNIPPLQWQDKDKPLLDHTIKEFQPLINRIDPKHIEALKMAMNEETQVATPPNKETKKECISIDDFAKVDLRVAKIVEAEAVEGADKLLRLMVDVGEEEKRQIFAGIKSAYQPEELVGRHVVVVANLEPRKMRFGVSEGMVLAAGNGGQEIWVISPDPGAEAGAKVK